jgi:hypothetical protein
MLARFLHWYPGYTAESALAMPASRFFALAHAIRKIEAAEDLRRLRIAATSAHPGQRGEHLAQLRDDLLDGLGRRESKPSTLVIANITPGVRSSDGLREELEQRIAAHQARLKAGPDPLR